MSVCCPPGSHGVLSESSSECPRGKEFVLGELSCYLAEPAEPSKKALLMLHDIFGPRSGRTKAIADRFASEGYIVLLPDVFVNDTWEPSRYFLERLPRLVARILFHKWENKVAELYEKAIAYLSSRADSIGLVGFCWGAYPMTRLLNEHRANSGLCFHPSLRVFSILLDFNVRKYLGNCNVPIAYLAAGNDAASVRPGGTADTVFKAKPFYDKCLFKEYNDMNHGWVNKGDLDDPLIKRDADDAIDLALRFFADTL